MSLDLKQFEKHTPGPWMVGGPYPSVSVIYEVSPAVGFPDPEPAHCDAVCILHMATTGEPPKQALLDARLLAAAPDLLAELTAARADADRLAQAFEECRKIAESAYESGYACNQSSACYKVVEIAISALSSHAEMKEGK